MLNTKYRKLFTRNNVPLTTGYNRIVYGERGAYVEFDTAHILKFKDQTFVPQHAQWRITRKYWKKVFYYEYRTKDSNIKLYFQRKTVSYADYVVGRWYVALKDIKFIDIGDRG